MKRMIALSSAFVIVFGLSLGLTLGLSEQAEAKMPCPYECTFDYYCSYDTGPNCPSPDAPYYMYRYNGTCWSGSQYFCPPDGFYSCCNFPGMWLIGNPRP